MDQNNKKRGFSVIELVLVIGIIVVVTAVALPNLFNRKSVTELTSVVNQISVTLREAQSRAISQNGGSEWGVRFDNGNPPYFAMFSTPNYSPSTRVVYNTLPQGIGYGTSTLNIGSYADVVFGQITGRPNRSLYLDLYLINNPQVTLAVSVSTLGQVTVLTKEILVASLYGSLQDILQLAKTAQQNSIDGVNNETWGVRFQNPAGATPYAELFYGAYSSATVTKHLDLLPGVDYDPASVPEGSSLNVTFSSNGHPSEAVTITTHLISYPAISTFVQIDNSGICAEGSCGGSSPPPGGGGGTGGGGTGGGGTGGGGGGGGGGCFTFDTLVDTPSGPRAIGKLGVGDTVYAYDENTGETVESQVTKVLVHPDNSYGAVTFSDGTSLEVTSVHRFYNPLTKKWLPIGEMQPGESVLRGLGPDARPITISSMEFTSGRGTVYNIEVNRYHTYYVNGVLVHNAKQPGL